MRRGRRGGGGGGALQPAQARQDALPFSTWELPEQAIAFCLAEAGLTPADVDVVAYSYDPILAAPTNGDLTVDEWEGPRTLFVERAPRFLQTLGFDRDRVRFVAQHVAHAASAHLASPYPTSAVLVADGRGESASSPLGRYDADGHLEMLAAQALPHSLGLLYEELTEHLGFRRSSDEYKVMAMASYGRATRLEELETLVHATGDGGFVTRPVDWAALAPALGKGGDGWGPEHADLAASVQRVVEDVLLDLTAWLHAQTGETAWTSCAGRPSVPSRPSGSWAPSTRPSRWPMPPSTASPRPS